MKLYTNIQIVKIVISILILFGIYSCNLNFEEEKNLRETKARLKRQLMLKNEDTISELKYFKNRKGYVYSFKTNSSVIEKVIKQLHMNIDTTGKYIWIPEESPSWFSPSLDYKETYIKYNSNRKEFLQFDKNQKIYYYANLNW